MRNSKEIDFTKVNFITYAVDEYLNDIPMYDLVNYYISLFQRDEHTYLGKLNDRDVIVNTLTNTCYYEGEVINGEQFVMLFEGEESDPTLVIKKITGIDLDDYISEVTYYDGTSEYLDVKGKKSFMGRWEKKKVNDR